MACYRANRIGGVSVGDDSDGVIVEQWIGSEVLTQLNKEIDPWLNNHPGTHSGSDASDDFLGKKTRCLQGLSVKTPTFTKLLTDDRLLKFAEQTIGSISPTLIMNNGEVIDISPGEFAQPMHRDDDAWHFVNLDKPLMINAIAALVDITQIMGATRVVPDSHQ